MRITLIVYSILKVIWLFHILKSDLQKRIYIDPKYHCLRGKIQN